MGNFSRAGNMAILSSEKLLRFEGVAGESEKVIKRITPDGDDLSGTVANLFQDVFCDKYGRIVLRPGCRKIETTGKNYSIGSIFMLNIGGLLNYGILYGGGLDLISVPWRDFPEEEIELEEEEARPSDWPDEWPWFPPVNDAPLPDPTEPVESQSCVVGYTIEGNPDTLSWSMPYADVSGLTSQVWRDKTQGYRPYTKLVASYNAPAAWLNTGFAAWKQFILGPCEGATVGGLEVIPNGKDASGDWLDPGTYTHTGTLTWSDGTVLTCVMTLVVAPPDITLTPVSGSVEVFEADAGSETLTLAISNSGDAGSTLNWEVASITGDAELTGILSASPSSGTLAQGASENVVLTLTAPGNLSAGSYSAVVNFRDSNLTTITDSYAVTLEVYPVYTTGRIQWDITAAVTNTFVSGDPSRVPADSTSSVTEYTDDGGPDSEDPYFWTTHTTAGGTGNLYGYPGETTLNAADDTVLAWGAADGEGGQWDSNRQYTGASLNSNGCPVGGWTRIKTTDRNDGAAEWTETTTYTISVGPE